jgi:dolichyl-phosphate beta-glucosyltransferase
VYLSLIIPAFNERDRIGPTLEKVFAYLSDRPYDKEVIVVDDGSKDDTVSVVRTNLSLLKTRFHDIEGRVVELRVNTGKGAAVNRGMLAAKGSIRIFTDADLSTPVHEVGKVVDAIDRDGYDVVVGSRALEGRQLVKKHQPWYRELMGRVFNIFVQIFVLRGIKDTQCGFKGFRGEVAEKLFGMQKVMGFSFDVEILYLARKHGYKIKEVAVEWYNDERTTVGALSDSTKMFLELLRIRKLHR